MSARRAGVVTFAGVLFLVAAAFNVVGVILYALTVYSDEFAPAGRRR